jgi:thiamine pyrophosphokinase
MLNIINKHKSIIFLNGTGPNKKLLQLLNTSTPIIAADGAANKIRALQLKPTYIVGDGDSYNAHAKNSSPQIITDQDQNSTDFEKCILFAQKNNLFPSLILGINGGEIDHTIGNMQAFLKHAQNFNLYFLDTYSKPPSKKMGIKIGIPLTNKKLALELEPQSTISVISFHNAIIQSSGLSWELNKFKLCIDNILGVRNINIQNCVKFEVIEGKVLLIIDISNYHFPL